MLINFFQSLTRLDQFLVEKDVEGPGPDASIWQPLLIQTLELHLPKHVLQRQLLGALSS